MRPPHLSRAFSVLAFSTIVLGASVAQAEPPLELAQVQAPRRLGEPEAATARPPTARRVDEALPTGLEDSVAEPPPDPGGRPFVPPPIRTPKSTPDSGVPGTLARADAGAPVAVGKSDAGTPGGPADAGAVPTVDAGLAPAAARTPGVDPRRPAARPLETPTAGDAELVALFQRWRGAVAKPDPALEETTERELIRLKDDLGISDLDSVSVAILRKATERRLAGELDRAVANASTAAELAPSLPSVRFTLAGLQLSQTPFDVGRYASELRMAVGSVLHNPRFQRAAVGNVGGAFLFAWVATATVLMAVLAMRRLRYLAHDVHHRFFPSAVARWQALIAVAVVLLLPWIFRQGLVPGLGLIFVGLCAYLGLRERIVAAVWVASLGLLPIATSAWIGRSAFSGTPAEEVYLLERGGLEARAVADRLVGRLEETELDFAQLFALARYEQRRGRLDDAIAHFKIAARQRPGDARLLTNLGNALLTKGDPEGAADLYRTATQADPTLAVAFLDTARLHQRRATAMRDDAVGAELERAQNALGTAQDLDPTLLSLSDPPTDSMLANRQLLAAPLAPEELDRLAAAPEMTERITAQLVSPVLGAVPPEVALVYPAGIAFIGLLWGTLRRRAVSRPCEKCGRAVCRKCDPELAASSNLCNQCVHAFARKGALAASVTVRKQIEIRRFQSRHERLSYLLGLLISGTGHLFNGVTLRGVVYVFLFLFCAFNAYFPDGLLRAPYARLPIALSLAPIGLLFAVVYGFSLRGLRRRLNT